MADLSGQGIEPLKHLRLQRKTQYKKKKMRVYIHASSWIWNHESKIPKLKVIISLRPPKQLFNYAQDKVCLLAVSYIYV